MDHDAHGPDRRPVPPAFAGWLRPTARVQAAHDTRRSHGLLLWMGILAVSAGLACATDRALVGAWAPPAATGVQPAAVDPAVASCEARTTRWLYVGLNSWIPAEPEEQPCLRPSADPGF